MGYVLALLVCTGPLKFILNYHFSAVGSRFELTAIASLLIIVIVLYRTVIKRESINNIFFGDIGFLVFFMGMFFVLYLLSMFYSVSDFASIEKIKRVSFLTVPSLFIPLLFLKIQDVKRFVRSYVYIVTGLALWTLAMFLTYGPIIYSTAFEVQVSHLLLGTLFGASILILVISQTERFIFGRKEALLFLIASFLALIANGSRGPIIFCVLTIFIYFLVIKRIFRYKLILIKGVVLIGMVIYVTNLYIPDFFLRTIGRFSVIIDSFEKTRTGGISRMTHIEKASEGINHLPWFGHGLGSYGVVAFDTDVVHLYPHNILLEIWFESGVISLLLFIVFIACVFIIGIKRIQAEQGDTILKKYLTLFALLSFYFLGNHLKSFDMVGFRVAGVFLGIFMFLQLAASINRYNDG